MLRPSWFTRAPEGPYRITQNGEPFVGHDIALDSLPGLFTIATTPNLYGRASKPSDHMKQSGIRGTGSSFRTLLAHLGVYRLGSQNTVALPS